MIEEQFSRTQAFFGEDAIRILQRSKVLVFGIGGVGGYAVEVLARSGVGCIGLVDADCVAESNLNRQIIATHTSLGKQKVDVAALHITDINPNCVVKKFPVFYLPSNADEIPLIEYDYIVDCIDTVSAKLEIIRRCHEGNIPIISCMGAGNKLDATKFRVADIMQTKMDPLARVIRKKLKEWDIRHLKVVYSEEMPIKIGPEIFENESQRVPASNAWVPAAAGLIIGGEVVQDLIKNIPSL